MIQPVKAAIDKYINRHLDMVLTQRLKAEVHRLNEALRHLMVACRDSCIKYEESYTDLYELNRR